MFDCLERKKRYQEALKKREQRIFKSLERATYELCDIFMTEYDSYLPIDEFGTKVSMVGIDLQEEKLRLVVKINPFAQIESLPKQYKGHKINYQIGSAPTIPDSVLELYGEQQ